MVMKIKLVVVVVVACQKQKSTGGGARSTTFCRNMGTARGVPT